MSFHKDHSPATVAWTIALCLLCIILGIIAARLSGDPTYMCRAGGIITLIGLFLTFLEKDSMPADLVAIFNDTLDGKKHLDRTKSIDNILRSLHFGVLVLGAIISAAGDILFKLIPFN